MEKNRCEYCGNVFDPVKSGVCPNCGAAVSPAVLKRIEQEQSASPEQNRRLKEEVLRREQAARSGQIDAPARPSNAARSSRKRSVGKGCATSIITLALTLLFCAMFIFIMVLIVFRNDSKGSGGIRVETVERNEGAGAVDLTEEPTDSPIPEETRIGSLGETLRRGNLEVTALGLRDYKTEWYEEQTLPEGAKIVAVEFRVKNVSNDTAPIGEVWGWAEDEEGETLITKEYAPNSAELNNSLFSGWLYAGHHTQGRVYFQVPAEAARLIVVFDNGPQFSIELS